MIEILIGISGAIVGAFVVKGGELLYWKYSERLATWRGKWLATLPAFGIRPERQDIWKFRQRGDTIYADILREKGPAEEIGSKWNFVGQARESQLFGAYENRDLDSLSYGGIMFTHTADRKYEGFYLRLERKDIVQAPIRLERW